MLLYNVKLGDICRVRGGFAFKSSDFISKGIPVIKIANIFDNQVNINDSTSYVESNFLDKCKDFIVEKGSLLIALSGATTGKYGIYRSEQKALLNQRVAMLVPDEDKTTSKFIFYCLKGLQKRIFDSALGAAQPNISTKEIEEFEIKFGEIDYQNKIISLLDTAQALIDKRKLQIEELSSLTKSVYLKMFGDPIKNTKNWKKVNFEEVINDIRYGTSTPPQFSDDGFMFIRATNIKKGKILKDNMFFINSNEADKIQKCILALGEIIFVRSGVNSGDNAIVTEEFLGHYGGYDIIVNINEAEVNPYFLNVFFNSAFLDVIIKPLTRRAGQPHLNADQIKGLNIQLPPLNLQNEFANIYKEIEFQKEIMRSNLHLLENNFNSLMHNAFSGELMMSSLDFA